MPLSHRALGKALILLIQKTEVSLISASVTISHTRLARVFYFLFFGVGGFI